MSENNENRSFLCFGEDEKKIEKIKEKYHNLEMSDEVAKKIQRLEVVNKILSVSMVAAGIATVIDIAIPDPVLGLDEALLTMLTASISKAKKTVKSHIDELAVNGTTEIKADKVTEFTNSITGILEAIKNRGNSQIK